MAWSYAGIHNKRLKTALDSCRSWLCIALAAVILLACESAPQVTQPEQARVDDLLSGEALIKAGVIQQVRWPEDQALKLTDEMKTFLLHYVNPADSQQRKLDALLYAIMHKGILGLRYDPTQTHTAEGAFSERTANCLSFSLLFTAMAREVGLKVWFNDVDVPPVWDLRDQKTFVLYKHINVMVRLRGDRHQIVDIDMERYNSNYEQKRLSDSEAMAQYYNNRGVEYLFAEDMEKSFNYLRMGLKLAPDADYIWSSLGALYRRAGLHKLAETAYLRALKDNSNNYLVLNNLSQLYAYDGQYEASMRYKRRVADARNSNPYYQYALAEKAYANDELEQAQEDISRALKKRRREHRFWHLSAQIHWRLKEQMTAIEDMTKAIRLAEDPEVLAVYEQTLNEWQGADHFKLKGQHVL